MTSGSLKCSLLMRGVTPKKKASMAADRMNGKYARVWGGTCSFSVTRTAQKLPLIMEEMPSTSTIPAV